MIQDALTFASDNIEKNKTVALVTVISTSGSSPATLGQMIAVLADGTTMGTVGGGASEHHVIERTVDAIKCGDEVFTLSIDHAEEGMICGGSMVVFGNIIGNHTGICIFGGGHIAQSLAKIAAQTGFSVTIIEDRPEFAIEFETAKYITCKPDEYEILDPVSLTDYVIICTRGHSTDDEALRYCLKKEPKYIGMIGSNAKVTTLFSQLRKEGINEETLSKIYAPVGLDIADAAPAEIAVAILAEILLIKNNGTPRHKKMIK